MVTLVLAAMVALQFVDFLIGDRFGQDIWRGQATSPVMFSLSFSSRYLGDDRKHRQVLSPRVKILNI